LKTVVVGQGLVITILGSALFNDYLHNVYLRIYVDGAVQRYIVAYSAFLGVSIGLIGACVGTLLAGAGTKRRTKPKDPSPMMSGALAQPSLTADKPGVVTQVATLTSGVGETPSQSNISGPSHIEASLVFPSGISRVIFCPIGLHDDLWRFKRGTGDFAIPGCWDHRIFR
jgi:hypothetical protein